MSCHGVDGDAGIIVDLEATGYDICGIDGAGHLECANKSGETWAFEEMSIGSNSYIDLGSTNQHMCALEDNDGDGSGAIYCFILENLGLADLYDVYEGPYTEFSIDPGQGIICALDTDGDIECIDPPANGGFDAIPSGPFVDTMIHPNGLCGLAADGTLSCSGDEWFEAWTLGPDCVLPTTDVIDMDLAADLPMVLTADGTITGWSDWQDCFSASEPGAVAVELGAGVVCTLGSDGSVACVDLDGADSEYGDILADTAPAGSFEHLAGNPINVGSFMCASAGSEVTCWGDGWDATTPQTFTLLD